MRNEDGALSIVVVTGVLALCFFALCAADLGSMLVARARAQGAADSAALAAAVQQVPVLGQGEDPEGAARAETEANGAELIRCSCEVGRTWATVEVAVLPRLTVMSAWFGRRARAIATAQVDEDVLTYRDGG